jgi:hypothetical protein
MNTSKKPIRRRKPRKYEPLSQLQRKCESAIQAPGGVSKVLHLIEGASDDDIKLLNEGALNVLERGGEKDRE